MHGHVVSLAVLIGFNTSGQAATQTPAPLHPCSFLTTAQISAAVGRVGESREGDMPGKAHMRACSWSIPGGLFTLSVGKVPKPNQSTRELLDYMNSMYDQLKGHDWKYEKRDLGSTRCSVVTPPAGAATGSPATFCATVVKGMLVMASASSKASIPAAELKLKSLGNKPLTVEHR